LTSLRHSQLKIENILFKTKLHGQPYNLSLMYPQCVDRPLTPKFVTPLYHQPSPYVQMPSTSPKDIFTKDQSICRKPWSKHLMIDCPCNEPQVQPKLHMFLECYKDASQRQTRKEQLLKWGYLKH